ncbi:hypothetical protein MMC25_008123 [Agyrium rufum]|nr:hypothetical protein [Agyrium rufum]
MASNGLAPISYASSVVGFLSFAFTFLTFLRVTWDAVMTIFAAPGETRIVLDNLRQELYELRENLRRSRKRRQKPDYSFSSSNDKDKDKDKDREKEKDREADYYSGGNNKTRSEKDYDRNAKVYGEDRSPLRVLSDTVKHLSREFERIERPFLANPREDADEVCEGSAWTHYRIYNSKVEYADMTLGVRFHWLRNKGRLNTMGDLISRIQVRRIAHEVGSLQAGLGAVERKMLDVDERMMRFERRLR